jgi:uncharacterized cupin superfamily protein
MQHLSPFTALDGLRETLSHEPVPPDQRIEGGPETGMRSLAVLGGASVGIWEMTAGGMRDVESDEVFIVLSGAAEVTWRREGGDDVSIVLAAGTICRLTAGMRTTWTVTETLRKVYVSAAAAERASA